MLCCCESLWCPSHLVHLQVLSRRVVEMLPLCLREHGEGTMAGGVVRRTGQLQGLARSVGGREPLLKVAEVQLG